jgi:hypothetical protein
MDDHIERRNAPAHILLPVQLDPGLLNREEDLFFTLMVR